MDPTTQLKKIRKAMEKKEVGTWSPNPKGERTYVGGCVAPRCKVKSKTNISEFKWIVSEINEAKRDVVRAVGFGYTLEIGCHDLAQAIIVETLHQVDHIGFKIRIHDVICTINGAEFGRVTGIYDGDEDVVIGDSSCAKDYGPEVLPMCDENENITTDLLTSIVRERNEADDTFKIAYVMLALHYVICPGEDRNVQVRLLKAVMETNRIVKKKWASFAVSRLMEGVRRHREEQKEIVTGCMLFLQLLYLDKVGEVVLPPQVKTCPMLYWTPKLIHDLVDKVKDVGGHSGPTVLSLKSKRTKKFEEAGFQKGPTGFKLQQSVHEDILYVRVNVDRVQKEMCVMKGTVDDMSSYFVEISKVVSQIADALHTIKGECGSKASRTLGFKRNRHDNVKEEVVDVQYKTRTQQRMTYPKNNDVTCEGEVTLN